VHVATQYAPPAVRRGPAAAHPLRLREALLPIAVGAININELMNINDVHTSLLQYSHAPAS